MIADRD